MKKTYIIFIIFLNSLNSSFAQEFRNYFFDNHITAVQKEGNILWIGNEIGLIKYQIDTGEKTYYDITNSNMRLSKVTGIEIDNTGNKWISTYGEGLIKYDGITFTAYNTNNSNLPYNFLNDVKIDSNGTIWVSHQGGISKFDQTSFSTYSPTNNYGYITMKLAIDNQNNIWISSGGDGIYVFDQTNFIEHYTTTNSGLPNSPLNSINFDNNDNLWIGTVYDGLIKFDGTNWTEFNTSNSIIADNNVSIQTSNNDIWVSTSHRIQKFDGSTNWDTVYCNYRLGNSIVIDQSGEVWLGAKRNGLIHLNTTNQQINAINFNRVGLQTNTAESLMLDHTNKLWVAGRQPDLLSSFDGSTWTAYQNTFGVRNLCEDNDGNIWAICLNYIKKYDGTNWISFHFSETGINNDIQGITIDNNNHLWVSVKDYGIVEYDGTQWIKYDTNNSGLMTLDLTNILFDANRDVLWIGSRDQGLIKYDGTNWTNYNTNNSNIAHNFVIPSHLDLNNTLWFRTISGGLLTSEINKYDLNSFTNYNTSNSQISSNKIMGVCSDTYNNIWLISYDNGLIKYDGTNWTEFNTSNSSIIANELIRINIDQYNNIWIGTRSKGLIEFNENSIIAGINEELSLQYIHLYPNPTHDFFTIDYDSKIINILIYDLSGKLIHRYKNEKYYQVNDISKGVYIVKIITDKGIANLKLIIN